MTGRTNRITRTHGTGRVFFLTAILAGIVTGVVITGFALKWVTESNSIRNGAWLHNPYVGSDEAGSYTRTLTALIGFLGMTREETIYFTARGDDEKNTLRGSCTYTVNGFFPGDQARWWSITAYDAVTSKLIPNDQKRYSFNSDNISFNDDGSFTLLLSPREPESTQNHINWIPLRQGRPFDLLLRMYNPSQHVRDNPHLISLPRIIKESCL